MHLIDRYAYNFGPLNLGLDIEGTLFALQAALGGGVLGYTCGYLQGRKKSVHDGDETNNV